MTSGGTGPVAASAAAPVATPVARCVARPRAELVGYAVAELAAELVVDRGGWFSDGASEAGMACLRHQWVKLSGAKRGSWRDFSRCKTLRSSVARTGACVRKLTRRGVREARRAAQSMRPKA